MLNAANILSNSPQERLYAAIIAGNVKEIKSLLSSYPDLASKPFDKEMPRMMGFFDEQTPMILALRCLENHQNLDIVECLQQYQASLMQLDSEDLNPLMIVLSKSTLINFRKLIALLKPEELKAQLLHRSKGNNVLSFATSYRDQERQMLLELAVLYSPKQLASELSFVNANKTTVLSPSYDGLGIVQREVAAYAQQRYNYEKLGFRTTAQRKEKAHAIFADVVSEYLKKLEDIQNTPPGDKYNHFIIAREKFEAISQYFDEALRQLAAWDIEKNLQDPIVKTFKKHMCSFEKSQLAFRKKSQLTYPGQRQEYDEMLENAIIAMKWCKVALMEPSFDSFTVTPQSTPMLNKFNKELPKRQQPADAPTDGTELVPGPASKEPKVSESQINYKLANR